MVEALTRALRSRMLLLAFFAVTSAVFAHRLDEYLQATLVAIEPNGVRLQINLTPGVDVADKVLAQIDRDHDSAISRSEARAYVELLRRDLTLTLDGQELKLKSTASQFATPVELHSGWGMIQVEFTATLGSLTTGAHKLVFENRHLTTLSVFLLNAAQPGNGAIQIKSQKRTENQASGEIEFAFHSTRLP